MALPASSAVRTNSRCHGTVTLMVTMSTSSSSIMSKGSEYQRFAPNVFAASRALSCLRVATAASLSPGSPLTAGTCEDLAHPPLAFAPMIPTRISLAIIVPLQIELVPASAADGVFGFWCQPHDCCGEQEDN